MLGLVVGAAAGWLWGWLGGGDDYLDSAVGTSFLCALAGLLAGAVTHHVTSRR